MAAGGDATDSLQRYGLTSSDTAGWMVATHRQWTSFAHPKRGISQYKVEAVEIEYSFSYGAYTKVYTVMM